MEPGQFGLSRVKRVQPKPGRTVGGQVRRVAPEWSRMTRINVEPETWIAFRNLCAGREVAASDALGELVAREVRAAQSIREE
jgi:hypothetical protein